MSSIKIISLENGFRVVFIPHKVGSVTCCLRGLAGSNYEKPDEVGVAHVLEHLCTYASKNFDTPAKLRGIVLANGGRVTGTTSRDDVAYLTKTLKENCEDGIKYLFETFAHPVLSQKNLEETKDIIKHEIYQNTENPKRYIGRISYQILFPNQRFSTFNTGSISDIDKLELDAITRFRERLYSPSNFVLSVCGDLDPNTLFSTVAKYFENIPGFNTKQALKHKPNYKRAFLVENRDSLDHLHLKIDYHGYKTGQKEKYAAYLLSKVLKNRLKARLSFSGINPYILDSSSFNSNSYGLFGTYTAIQTDQLETFFKVYEKVLHDLCNKKIMREELTFLKRKARADLEFALEKTSLRADFYSELYLYENLTGNHKDEIGNYLNCTSSNILNVANSLLKQEPKITVIDKSASKGEVERIFSRVFD